MTMIFRSLDHCHLTGSYRGATHSYCNIKFRLPKFLPVFFHNLAGYDAHLFIRKLGEMSGNINVIPKTKENYISFTKYFAIGQKEYMPVRFVDSFKFLGTSLEKVADNLKSKEFVNLMQFYPDEKQFNLLRRKGIYPYEYMKRWECYEEQKLPSRDCFNSCLTDEMISV